ncbi:MAG TPA: uridylate kinase, partial [Methylophilaceae bacterium]|nr:uridylate kinase [Methylophilaceae bacterium]
SPDLESWLDIISRYGDGKVVIVPGGGVFADAVRKAQQLSGINDKVAHQLAVQAMDQYGVLMAGLNRGLATAASELEIAERGWQHRGIVWLPSRMVCADEDIPASWDVTSDSLAAWLAHTLGADNLILVKSVRPQASRISFASLTEDGIVDACFERFTEGRSFTTWVLGKEDHALFQHGISLEHLARSSLPVRQLKNLEVSNGTTDYRAHS